MKNIKVSVIIRTFNESKWISLCVKKLVEQSIKPSEIILIDNNSFDGTKRVAKSISKKLKVFHYSKKYFPGKMLNFGISKSKGNYILIISAHCIPYNNKLIENLLKPLQKDDQICASYSRQIPLEFSDNSTFRDLMLLYGPESRLQKNDPKFNNACSLIRKKDWQNNKFNEKITNIEDQFWASQKIKKKRFIYYAADSIVYHYHGAHQNENASRLQSTTSVIKGNKSNFNILPSDLKFSTKDILPVFIQRNSSKIKIEKFVSNLSKLIDSKIILFKNSKLILKKKKNLKIISRSKNEIKNENLYLSDVIDIYSDTIFKQASKKQYLLIYTDKCKNLSHNNLNKIIKLINSKFPDTIFFARSTIEPIFSDDEEIVKKIHTPGPDRKLSKGLFIAKRENGILIHISNLFKKDKFSGNIKIIKI